MFFSPLEQFDIVLGNFLVKIPQVLIAFLIIFLFYGVLVKIYKNNYGMVPTFMQKNIEIIIIFVLGVVKQQVGLKGFKYLPLIMCFFLYILSCNFLSLTPYAVALTSQIILVFLITFTICSAIFMLGLLNQGVYFLKIFVPQSPLLLLFILIPIEIFSYVIRALSMAIRLSANIIAGHTLVFIISSFLLLVFTFNLFIFFFSWLSLLAILLLEFGVAFLQAYVFTVLFSIYLHDSLYVIEH